MKTYRSRVSISLITVLYMACIIQGAYSYLTDSFDPAKSLLLFGIITLIAMVFCFGIKYVIKGDKLEIYTIGMREASIDIKSITGFEENHNVLSAPAASLSRLWVNFGKGERVNISPRNQEQFIAEIEAIRNAK